jgi:hypothetical protein
MSEYMDMTAAELATCLERAAGVPGSTGTLSMLDEATLEYGWRWHESIGPAHRAFERARMAHQHAYRPERGQNASVEWLDAMVAARDLAAVLRPLGNYRLPRCGRPSVHGTCTRALDDDGKCPSTFGHTD